MMIRSGRQMAAGVGLVVALAAGAGIVATQTPERPASPSTVALAPAQRTMATDQELLAQLPTRSWGTMTGYSRERFGLGKSGSDWPDTDGNGCDQRNDTLRRDLADVTLKPGRKPCTVLTGVLRSDPYTARSIPFRYGRGTSDDIQIEHVVALANAWRTGASSWTPDKRKRFATDPRNLISVDGPQNASKGDQDAATWLVPLNPGYRCAYARKQIEVKSAYGLSATQQEKAALNDALGKNC